MLMKLTIRLLPPYSKKGEKNEHVLELPGEVVELRNLALYLSSEFGELLHYPLFDKKGLLTAEFMVNGKHQPVGYRLKEGDSVAVIPYICGG